ncbi:hypothetical protein F4859DRAFT_464491 [Xylaria cf. heliscus]|nr:hypothetical protein F4859DRAFT_464491 [Xylaria cf. heliscus]
MMVLQAHFSLLPLFYLSLVLCATKCREQGLLKDVQQYAAGYLRCLDNSSLRRMLPTYIWVYVSICCSPFCHNYHFRLSILLVGRPQKRYGRSKGLPF